MSFDFVIPTQRALWRIFRERTLPRRVGVSRRDYCTAPRLPVKHKSVDSAPLTSQIEAFLAAQNVKFTDGYTCFAMMCPKFVKFKLKDVDSLYINKITGHFMCRSCKKSGPWPSLQDNIKLLKSTASSSRQICFSDTEPDLPDSKDLTKITQSMQSSTLFSKLEPTIQEQHLRNYNLECISAISFEKYGVRCDEDGSLILPCYNYDNRVTALKTLNQKSELKLAPKTDSNFIFGLNTITSKTRRVILTASELDAVAAHQETKLPALALTRGTKSLPQNILPFLEQFDEITIWFGNDVDSWNDAKMFAKKLDERRCRLVRPSIEQPSALQCLRAQKRLADMVKSAQRLANNSVITFRELRQEVYAQLTHAEQVAGVKWRRYPKLNTILKGHRRGELTVFTGPTGSGKTTFISDYSLDLCLQGVNTLWGSFEITNVRLTKMMLQQFARRNLYKSLHEFEQYADSFEALPLYFMAFHGSETIQNVIETMAHSVYVYDIAHVVVDNLQFMMGTDRFASSADRFWQQDHIISAFRRFATTQNCHVTLVIHPRKEEDDALLSKSSIFGSAKATQESDNIMILQDQSMNAVKEGRKYVQVVKNRFDGELGSMMLKFDKESLSFSTSEARTIVASTTPVNDSDMIIVPES